LASSPKLDVWAIGLMFYAMMYGTLPFYSNDEHELKRRIKTGKLTFPSDVPITPMGKDLMMMMLTRDPKQRLDLMNFMNMEYYNIDDFEFAE
jgi:serine/threonine protein kinase